MTGPRTPGTGPKRWAVVREAVDVALGCDTITTMHVYAEGCTTATLDRELSAWRTLHELEVERGISTVEHAIFTVIDITQLLEPLIAHDEEDE